jgi:hypothetical protein
MKHRKNTPESGDSEILCRTTAGSSAAMCAEYAHIFAQDDSFFYDVFQQLDT